MKDKTKHGKTTKKYKMNERSNTKHEKKDEEEGKTRDRRKRIFGANVNDWINNNKIKNTWKNKRNRKKNTKKFRNIRKRIYGADVEMTE